MTIKPVLRECSPHLHPYRWLGINCAVLLWSAILLWRIIDTIESRNPDYDYMTRVEWSYLVYNFAACAVWVAEVFFNVLDFRGYFDSGEGEKSLLRPTGERKERTRGEVVALWVETGLAAYFFLGSMVIAHHLSKAQIHKQSRGMIFDVCLNMVAYAYIVYRQYVDWRESGNESGQTENLSVTEKSAEGLV
mmetsp:Transcript_28557/g.60554  ORF Transcript_28557/g.60554 Transcript_28557/m.60554 type:complete len:191 (-) Transcript_28557:363-935(-)